MTYEHFSSGKKGRDATHRPHNLGTHLTHPCGSELSQFWSRRRAGSTEICLGSRGLPPVREPSPRPLGTAKR